MVGKATRFGVTVLLCVGSGQNLLSPAMLSAHSVWHWLDTVKKIQFMPEKIPSSNKTMCSRQQTKWKRQVRSRILKYLGSLIWMSEISFRYFQVSINPLDEKIPWRRKWNPLQYSCLENPMSRGAQWAAVQGVVRIRHDLANKQQSFR